MTTPEQARWWTLLDAARLLGVHPFEVARLLGAEDRLPRTLVLDPLALQDLTTLAGIETWWKGEDLIMQDSPRPRALIRSLAAELIARGIVGERTTRVDNLFRGLAPADADILRAAVNHLIRLGWLTSSWTRRGLQVGIVEAHLDDMADLADGDVFPPIIESLCS